PALQSNLNSACHLYPTTNSLHRGQRQSHRAAAWFPPASVLQLRPNFALPPRHSCSAPCHHIARHPLARTPSRKLRILTRTLTGQTWLPGGLFSPTSYVNYLHDLRAAAIQRFTNRRRNPPIGKDHALHTLA